MTNDTAKDVSVRLARAYRFAILMAHSNTEIPMRLEHAAITVQDPAKFADWWCKNLGFKIVRKMDTAPFMHFIVDGGGKMMLEIYNNPKVKVPDYRAQDALILHFAFVSENPTADRDRLIKAGATLDADLLKTPAGDELVMLRDPWGVAIQMCKREKPMV